VSEEREARLRRWAVPDLLLDVGLTGGIASGKSTVDRLLERRGARIIDADALVHALLGPGQPDARRVADRFGPGVLLPDGAIDRKALASIVFRDAEARADLNAILHPAVRREEDRLKDGMRRSGGGISITDAALLVETGTWARYDRLVVVACDPGLQLSRLLAREPTMDPHAAMARLQAQAPLAEKVRVADYVIDTSGSLGDTESRTRRVYVQLREDLPDRPHLEQPPS
jgi:dephospho-CoA kinase